MDTREPTLRRGCRCKSLAAGVSHDRHAATSLAMAEERKGVEASEADTMKCGVHPARRRRLLGVVIGNSAYPTLGGQDLPKCVGDADAMTWCLTEDLHAAEGDVWTLHNASVDKMRGCMLAMLDALESGSTAVLYFSGHGRECNGDVLMMASSGGELSLLEVLEFASLRISADHDPLSDVTLVVLLDCCRSLCTGG